MRARGSLVFTRVRAAAPTGPPARHSPLVHAPRRSGRPTARADNPIATIAITPLTLSATSRRSAHRPRRRVSPTNLLRTSLNSVEPRPGSVGGVVRHEGFNTRIARPHRSMKVVAANPNTARVTPSLTGPISVALRPSAYSGERSRSSRMPRRCHRRPGAADSPCQANPAGASRSQPGDR
jgi:hypothetical protein